MSTGAVVEKIIKPLTADKKLRWEKSSSCPNVSASLSPPLVPLSFTSPCPLLTLTSFSSCRFVSKLMWGPHAAPGSLSQGKPFYFISHGWSRPFSELVGMVQEHFRQERGEIAGMRMCAYVRERGLLHTHTHRASLLPLSLSSVLQPGAAAPLAQWPASLAMAPDLHLAGHLCHQPASRAGAER
jgi:hypothetical protein